MFLQPEVGFTAEPDRSSLFQRTAEATSRSHLLLILKREQEPTKELKCKKQPNYFLSSDLE